MNLLLKPAAVFFSAYTMISFQPLKEDHAPITQPLNQVKNHPRIQAAILLDVSNSMDGLIAQAKAQLWNMVSVMGKAKCNGVTPRIEIALYEYGRDNNNPSKGYVKQVSPFTNDLDKLSQDLFSLTTNGGEEFCGQVIHTSLNELNWDASPGNYKVIFISGNEDFLQGNVSYTVACAEARKKGVIVNTIYCGDRLQGIKEHWNLLGECGNGRFTNINSNAGPEDIPTPYDSALITLNTKLNSTYIYYGNMGSQKLAMQGAADHANAKVNNYTAVNRAAVKSRKATYNNAGWDLIDAKDEDKKILEKIDYKTLPDSLQNKNKVQLEAIVTEKSKERAAIQSQMQTVNAQREKYIEQERKRKTTSSANATTLEGEVEKMIREQAGRFNMKIE